MPRPFTIASRGMFSRDLELTEAGIRRGKRLVVWEEVDYYGCDWQDWSLPGDFVLVCRTGGVLRISPFYDRWHETADRVLAELHPRLRVQPYFDPFSLEQDALVHVRAGRLLLGQIDHIEIGLLGTSVSVIVHERGAKEWVTAEPSQIANFWLWLEVMNERGITVSLAHPLRLPNALSALAERIAATARLPKATVVRSR